MTRGRPGETAHMKDSSKDENLEGCKRDIVKTSGNRGGPHGGEKKLIGKEELKSQIRLA